VARYRVVGAHAVLGHEPGATFEADLSKEQEDYFVAAGHIAPVTTRSKPVDKPAENEEED
jgi:hypothetical protein